MWTLVNTIIKNHCWQSETAQEEDEQGGVFRGNLLTIRDVTIWTLYLRIYQYWISWRLPFRPEYRWCKKSHRKGKQFLCDSFFVIFSTARCSRRSSVLNLSDKPLLILGWVGFWHIALSVPNGPSGSSMVPVDPQMAPDSPRESQTIIQVSEKFPSFTIFLSTIY